MDLGKGGERSFWEGSSRLIGFEAIYPAASDDFVIALTGAQFIRWNSIAAKLFGLP
jgi:hypothetical protein